MILAPQNHIAPERSRYLLFQQTVLKPRSQESRQARRQRALNSRNASQTHNSKQPPIPMGQKASPSIQVKNITGIKGTIHNAELVPKPARLEAGEAVSPRHQRTHGSNTDSAPLNFSPEIQRRHSKSASRQKILTKRKTRATYARGADQSQDQDKMRPQTIHAAHEPYWRIKQHSEVTEMHD